MEELSILLVDDIEMNLFSMERLLQDLDMPGLEIDKANSGEQAIKLALRKSYSLILLDVAMPGMDGFEVAAMLDSYTQTKHIPIMFVTANRREESQIIKGYDYGAIDYVVKPINGTVFLAKIRSFLRFITRPNMVRAPQSGQVSSYFDGKHEYDRITGLKNLSASADEINGLLNKVADTDIVPVIGLICCRSLHHMRELHSSDIVEEFLHLFVDRIRSAMSPREKLYRYSDDCFLAVMFKNKSQVQSYHAIHRMLFQLTQPYHFDEVQLTSSISLGLAAYPQCGSSAKELLNTAEKSLDQAMASDKDTASFYTDAINITYKRSEKILKSIPDALVNKDIVLSYQPLVRMENQAIVGLEVFPQWRLDECGLLEADEFIPIAEDSGQIHDMGRLILAEAFKQYSYWMKSYPDKELTLTISASPLQLNKPSFFQDIDSLVELYDFNASQIVFELSETSLSGQPETLTRALAKLRQYGVSLSIDNFGSDYSSLKFLGEMDIKSIKLNAAAVATFCQKNDSDKTHPRQAILSALSTIANAMLIDVIAEGVTTKEQVQFLMEHGVNTAQGDLFYPRLSKDKVQRLWDQDDAVSVG